MNFQDSAFIPVILLGITSVFLLVSQSWRSSIAALAVQYLAVFWLVALVWPFGLAAVKLVAGWMAAAVLSASRLNEDILDEKTPGISGALFRLIAAGLVLTLVFSALPLARSHLASLPLLLEGGMILIGLGLLHLGMSTRPLRVVIGLLTVLSGFELVYAGLETSILIAGLQAVVTLGLALIGAYLLAVPDMEESG
jgi:hypothetical protein